MNEIVPYEAVSGEVLPPAATLDELIARANREHHLVEEVLGQALQHVITCGALLTEMRDDHIAIKGWEAWVEERFDGGHNTAAAYMRIYKYRELVQDLPSIKAAMQRLRGMPALRRGGYRGYSEEVKEEARALAAAGMTKTEIANILGVTRQTITNWIDSEALKRHKARVQADSARRREENRKKKMEAAQRAAEREAKRVGGSLAEAYSLVHKLEAPLARAEREATDPEVKKSLSEAITLQHKMLDRITSALGAS